MPTDTNTNGRLVLYIDNRERDAIDAIRALQMNGKFADVETRVQALPLADFALCVVRGDKEGKELPPEELVLFERKALPDLAASIKDGRYREQSARLQASPVHNHNVVYIVEGIPSQYARTRHARSMPLKTLYSSMCSLLLYKGFSMVRTTNVDDTVLLLLQCATKVAKERKARGLHYSNRGSCPPAADEKAVLSGAPMVGGGGGGGEGAAAGVFVSPSAICVPEPAGGASRFRSEDAEGAYASVIKKVKKDNLRPDNIGGIILSQLPGLSAVSALAIMNKCGSLRNLIARLAADDSYLDDIRITAKSGSTRKLSSAVIRTVKEYLLYGDGDEN